MEENWLTSIRQQDNAVPSGQSIARSLNALIECPALAISEKPGIVEVLLGAAYGAKYPDISRIKSTGCDPKALIAPFTVGTIAILDVIAPSMAFSVETSGCVVPAGQRVRKPKGAGGTTVAFSAKD